MAGPRFRVLGVGEIRRAYTTLAHDVALLHQDPAGLDRADSPFPHGLEAALLKWRAEGPAPGFPWPVPRAYAPPPHLPARRRERPQARSSLTPTPEGQNPPTWRPPEDLQTLLPGWTWVEAERGIPEDWRAAHKGEDTLTAVVALLHAGRGRQGAPPGASPFDEVQALRAGMLRWAKKPAARMRWPVDQIAVLALAMATPPLPLDTGIAVVDDQYQGAPQGLRWLRRGVLEAALVKLKGDLWEPAWPPWMG